MAEDARKLPEDHQLRDLIEPSRAEGFTAIRKLAALREDALGFQVPSCDKQNFMKMVEQATEVAWVATREGDLWKGLTARSGILKCLSHMTEVKVQVDEQECTILKCDENFKLSKLVSPDFPDFVLIRQCTLDIISLSRAKMAEDIQRFLITGTPGVGKTVSIIVWLYLAWKGELNMPFKHIIADLKTGRALLSRTDSGGWVEEWVDRNMWIVRWIPDSNTVLYLYEAAYRRQPHSLPYCSVVFSPPNLLHFKEFLKAIITDRMIYFTPTWRWEEIEALYRVSTVLQARAPLADINRLFELWGGVPKQIFVPYQIGYNALTCAISNCNAAACIQLLEKGSFLSYEEGDFKEVRSVLMHFEVDEDETYEHAPVNFGSRFIMDSLVEASGKSVASYYREFMNAHG